MVKPNILIYGASSQVGSSVALFLTQNNLAECTCLLRNSNSGIFFEINEIPFIIADKLNIENIKQVIQSHDIVLDFTYPSGQANEILETIKINMQNIITHMSASQKYFHMSSIMAYGLPDGEKQLRNYKIPRAGYGYIKRKAELFAKKLGLKHNVPIYNFRLGQVHGFLQSVNTSYREKLSVQNRVYIDGAEHDKVNIIFINSLSYAILDCFNNKYQPDIYTLVNYPQWSVRELYTYYSTKYKLKADIVYQPSQENKGSNKLKSSLIQMIKKYRPLLETYILYKFPSLYRKVKGKFRQTNLQHAKPPISYVDFHILGEPSTPVIPTKYSALQEVLENERQMEELYNLAIQKNVYD